MLASSESSTEVAQVMKCSLIRPKIWSVVRYFVQLTLFGATRRYISGKTFQELVHIVVAEVIFCKEPFHGVEFKLLRLLFRLDRV